MILIHSALYFCPKHIHTNIALQSRLMKASAHPFNDLMPVIKAAVTLSLMIAAMLAIPSLSADEDWLADSFNSSGNATDSLSPSISAFDFSPRELTVDDSGAKVILKAEVAGSLDGLQTIEVLFVSPSGSQSRRILMNSSNLISQSDASPGASSINNYAGRISFLPSSEEGNWSLQQLLVCGSSSICNRLNGSAAEKLGFPVTLQVRKAGKGGERGIEKDIEGPEGPSIDMDPDELRGWANTDELFYKNGKVLINNIFNRPALCWP